MTIHQEQLIEAFSDCVGREKAAQVITNICENSDFEGSAAYDEDEAIEIAVQVANQSDATPFVRTAANTLQTRIRAGTI